MKQNQVVIDFIDAIEWLECSLEIFHDEPAERHQNIKNLLRVLEAMTQSDVDQIVYQMQATADRPLTLQQQEMFLGRTVTGYYAAA